MYIIFCWTVHVAHHLSSPNRDHCCLRRIACLLGVTSPWTPALQACLPPSLPCCTLAEGCACIEACPSNEPPTGATDVLIAAFTSPPDGADRAIGADKGEVPSQTALSLSTRPHATTTGSGATSTSDHHRLVSSVGRCEKVLFHRGQVGGGGHWWGEGCGLVQSLAHGGDARLWQHQEQTQAVPPTCNYIYVKLLLLLTDCCRLNREKFWPRSSSSRICAFHSNGT